MEQDNNTIPAEPTAGRRGRSPGLASRPPLCAVHRPEVKPMVEKKTTTARPPETDPPTDEWNGIQK